MNIKIASLLALVILLVGVGFFYRGQLPFPAKPSSPFPSPTPLLSSLDSLSPRDAEKLVSGVSLKYTPVPFDQLTKPATCRVQGSIEFVKANTYITRGAKISWTGIDNPARQIKWSISPQDNLRIGPNLMANLPIPDGSADVGVTLPSAPKAKHYLLTARMTYSRLVNSNPKDFEAACSGKVAVDLNY